MPDQIGSGDDYELFHGRAFRTTGWVKPVRSADTDDIDTDIGTLLTRLSAVKSGYLDAAISSRSSHDAAAVKTAIEAGGGALALILEDTGVLQQWWVDGGRLDSILDLAAAGGDATAANQAVIVAAIAALNNLSTSDIDARLQAIGLQYLLSTAHTDGKPTADSIFDRIMNKDANQNFNRGTDALEALYDKIPGSASQIILTPLTGAAVQSVVRDSQIVEIVRGDAGDLIPYSLGVDLTGYTVEFGAKRNLDDSSYAVDTKDIEPGISDLTTGAGYIPLTADETGSLVPGATYWGEIRITAAEEEKTLLQFPIKVLQDVMTA